ncbi:MAG: Nif3-like dinuclear metal center hexameric protein [Streptococcaceae bacterium]|jgi:dinuclear metal center YbgI/SA1388 family protein|nr:Nif3-like dinuclear metal center hexameric protein [Streptococcaceae bacterium]
MNAQELIKVFEEYCPQELAETGDPVGLHIGTLNKEIKKVMITLDVRPETIEEAIEKNIDLLIAKHPPIFRPVKRLTTNDPQTKMYVDCLKHDIAIYAAHTNIDIIENGLNDWFSEMLGIENTQFLEQTHEYQGKIYGIGRIGDLRKPVSINEFAEKIKTTFGTDGLRMITKTPDAMVQRVAICGGSGEKFYPTAIAKGADLYITGDIYYHTAHDMIANGLHAIDPGHHIEILFTKKVAQIVQNWKKEYNWVIEVFESTANTNPFIYK